MYSGHGQQDIVFVHFSVLLIYSMFIYSMNNILVIMQPDYLWCLK